MKKLLLAFLLVSGLSYGQYYSFQPNASWELDAFTLKQYYDHSDSNFVIDAGLWKPSDFSKYTVQRVVEIETVSTVGTRAYWDHIIISSYDKLPDPTTGSSLWLDGAKPWPAGGSLDVQYTFHGYMETVYQEQGVWVSAAKGLPSADFYPYNAGIYNLDGFRNFRGPNVPYTITLGPFLDPSIHRSGRVEDVWSVFTVSVDNQSKSSSLPPGLFRVVADTSQKQFIQAYTSYNEKEDVYYVFVNISGGFFDNGLSIWINSGNQYEWGHSLKPNEILPSYHYHFEVTYKGSEDVTGKVAKWEPK